MTNTQPSISCPHCQSQMTGIHYDIWLCDICMCTWEITKHEITVGDKIDLE